MKKAGTGRDTSFPSENLKPVVWPYGQEYPSCPSFTKKANLFLSGFFCCVPSNTIFVRKTIISLHPFSSFFILFHPFSSKKAEKGRKTTLIIIVYLFLLAKKISLFKDKR